MQLQRLYIPLLFTTKKEDKKEDVFKEKKEFIRHRMDHSETNDPAASKQRRQKCDWSQILILYGSRHLLCLSWATTAKESGGRLESREKKRDAYRANNDYCYSYCICLLNVIGLVLNTN